MFQNKKIIIIAVVVLVILIIIGTVFLLLGCKQPRYSLKLEIWGVYDDSDIYQPLIADFNNEFRQKFSSIDIKYYKKTYQDYEKDLLEAMAANAGPDILMIHHTWLTRYKDKILPMPSKFTDADFEPMTLNDFQNTFVDVVIDDFVDQGSIWGMPLYVDTLALYYNKDIFNTVGIAQPPTTWKEFMDEVKKIRIKDESDNIIRAGAAIGTANNINRATDILSLLMLQSGTKMVSQDRTQATFNQSVSLDGKPFYPGQEALRFYTEFADPERAVYTWNIWMETPYSIDAFAQSKTAMMFNYSYHLPTIRAKSPYLNFAVAPMPQHKDSPIAVNYANYWGLAVSKNCQTPVYTCEQAWQFILWLSQKENAQKYLTIAKKPTARRDLIAGQENDPDLGVFAKQALTARSWYQVDDVSIGNILADMIESVVTEKTPIADAIDRAAAQITVLMRK